jgi:hypothetical protein
MPRAFFQGKGRQIFEKKDQNSNKKPANCRLREKQQTNPLPIGQIVVRAKA